MVTTVTGSGHSRRFENREPEGSGGVAKAQTARRV